MEINYEKNGEISESFIHHEFREENMRERARILRSNPNLGLVSLKSGGGRGQSREKETERRKEGGRESERGREKDRVSDQYIQILAV